MAFISPEPSIHRWLQTGLIPLANINLARDLNNKFSFNAGLSVHKFGKTNESSLNSPYLNDPEQIKALIQYTLERGILLGNVVASPEGNTYRLLRPRVMKPEFIELCIVVSPNNRITSAEFEHFAMQSLNYVPKHSIKFSPPPWPSLPYITHEKLDYSQLISLLGAMLRTASDKQK